MDRSERLQEFFRRLEDAEPAMDRNSARQLIHDILDGVEDEFTDFPNDRSPMNNRMYFYTFAVEEWKALDKDPCHINLNGSHRIFIYNNGSIVMHRTRENPAFEFFRKKGDKVKISPKKSAFIGEVEVSIHSEVMHPMYKKGIILNVESWGFGSLVAEIEFEGIGIKHLSIQDALLSLPPPPPLKEIESGLFSNLKLVLRRKYNKLFKRDKL